MSRLTIEIPSELGADSPVTERNVSAEAVESIEDPTPTVVRWTDCWAGRDQRVAADGR